MSVKSVGWAIEQDVGNATKKLVLVGICNHDGDGGSWPSRSTLARYAGCSERTVIRLTQELEAEGWITIHKQGGGTVNTRADRRTNLYVVNYSRGDSRCHPVDERGDKQDDHGVTNPTPRGDIAVSPEPSSNHPLEPNKHTGDMVTSERETSFAGFWEQYPRKEGKHTARGRWDKMSHDDRAAVFEALDDWCAYYATIDPKFIPHGSTWLNQRRWEDDPPDTPEPVQLAVVPSVQCDECDGTGWVEVDDPTLRAGRGMTKCDCQR